MNLSGEIRENIGKAQFKKVVVESFPELKICVFRELSPPNSKQYRKASYVQPLGNRSLIKG